MTERNIEATPQRRRQARLEGRFPRSRELTVGICGILGLGLAWWMAPALLRESIQFVSRYLSTAPDLHVDKQNLAELASAPLREMIAMVAPTLIIGLVTVFGVQLTQGGFVWVPNRIAPDASRIGPANLSNLLSSDRTIRALFAVFKMLAGLAVLLLGVWFYRNSFVGSATGGLAGAVAQIAAPMAKVTLLVMLTVTVLSAAEYGVRLMSYYRSLRMSANEMRDENRGRSTMRVQTSLSVAEKPKE